MRLVRGASLCGPPLGLELTRQRPTHSLEEEIFLCVGFSLSPSAPSVPLCPVAPFRYPESSPGLLALFHALCPSPSHAV